MFIQCVNTGTGEDSGCFSTSDPNSSNQGRFSPSLLNQCKGSAITPTLPSLEPHQGLETGIATTPKAPGTASAECSWPRTFTRAAGGVQVARGAAL